MASVNTTKLTKVLIMRETKIDSTTLHWAATFLQENGFGTAADRIISEATRIDIEQQEAAEARQQSADDAFRDWCARNSIDASMVVRDSVRQTVDMMYMWKTPLAWPAGGTYEDAFARNSEDEMVASRATSTYELTVIGHDSRGTMLPTSGDHVLTELVLREEGPWIWRSDERG